MCATSAASTPLTSVQLPSGDTSGEGNTAGTDGQGGPAINSPAPSKPQNLSSSGGGDDEKGGDDKQGSPAGSTCSNSPRYSSPGDVTEQEAQRLKAENSLSPSEFGPRGEVLAPTRHDFSVDISSLGR
ncbi:hypothetical protein PR003_g8288 [Phytophthora rubi]|uniref:Uncharacterized protein n=1 Tax=Phytophthora rubi TaxID=129364 RepID=A0A6A4FBL4_9STRA|nr:hypothetical protein PR003_g8288 [Phytophthora rubi]